MCYVVYCTQPRRLPHVMTTLIIAIAIAESCLGFRCQCCCTTGWLQRCSHGHFWHSSTREQLPKGMTYVHFAGTCLPGWLRRRAIWQCCVVDSATTLDTFASLRTQCGCRGACCSASSINITKVYLISLSLDWHYCECCSSSCCMDVFTMCSRRSMACSCKPSNAQSASSAVASSHQLSLQAGATGAGSPSEEVFEPGTLINIVDNQTERRSLNLPG